MGKRGAEGVSQTGTTLAIGLGGRGCGRGRGHGQGGTHFPTSGVKKQYSFTATTGYQGVSQHHHVLVPKCFIIIKRVSDVCLCLLVVLEYITIRKKDMLFNIAKTLGQSLPSADQENVYVSSMKLFTCHQCACTESVTVHSLCPCKPIFALQAMRHLMGDQCKLHH